MCLRRVTVHDKYRAYRKTMFLLLYGIEQITVSHCMRFRAQSKCSKGFHSNNQIETDIQNT